MTPHNKGALMKWFADHQAEFERIQSKYAVGSIEWQFNAGRIWYCRDLIQKVADGYFPEPYTPKQLHDFA